MSPPEKEITPKPRYAKKVRATLARMYDMGG
jgi:hypothetical protein